LYSWIKSIKPVEWLLRGKLCAVQNANSCFENRDSGWNTDLIKSQIIDLNLSLNGV